MREQIKQNVHSKQKMKKLSNKEIKCFIEFPLYDSPLLILQMFQRLCIHVIQRLRPVHAHLYLQPGMEDG